MTVAAPDAPPGTAELEKALVGVVGAGVADGLGSLAASPRALARLADASCWHANGFAKIVLHRGEHGALRLHVWPTDRPQTGDSEPHSHRWDFASTVLAGALTIAEYAEAPAGLRYLRCTYDGQDVRGQCETHLVQDRTFQVFTGERYVTDRKVIHKVHPRPGGLVATLLVQGPHRAGTTNVYRVGPGLPPARPIDTAEVRSLLLAVRDALVRGVSDPSDDRPARR